MKRVKKFKEVFTKCGHLFYPIRAHRADAGLDLRTPISFVVPAHGSTLVDLDIHFDIPRGWFGKLESKSGLNIKHQIFLAGGTIDSGYTGSIQTRLYNFSDDDYIFEEGDKVCQIIFIPISTPIIRLCETLPSEEISERGNDGFGSSGK